MMGFGFIWVFMLGLPLMVGAAVVLLVLGTRGAHAGSGWRSAGRGAGPGCGLARAGYRDAGAPTGARAGVVPGSPDAIAVLRDRYARGLIEPEDFERRLQGLLSWPPV